MAIKDVGGEFAELLEKIFNERGWDFRGYKRASLARRISKRLSISNISSYRDYGALLDSDPAEYDRLFSSITIKVSEFFRDPEVFETLGGAIKSFFQDTDGLKAWCCGCSCGEEAYSLAILLSDCLGQYALKNTRIFATDIDAAALDQARKAVYREDSLKNVGPLELSKYFTLTDHHYKVNYGIRNMVKFGTLDIVKNPSIIGVQIMFCRNLFIYFNKALQKTVFEKLDYALRPGGLLVMGKAEVLPPQHAHRYMQIGGRASIYRKRV